MVFIPGSGSSYVVKRQYVNDMLAVRPIISRDDNTVSVPEWLDSQTVLDVTSCNVSCTLKQLVDNIKTANFLGHERYLGLAYDVMTNKLLSPKQLLFIRIQLFGYENLDPNCNLLYKIWWYMNYDPLNMSVEVVDIEEEVEVSGEATSQVLSLEHVNITEMLSCAKFPTINPDVWLLSNNVTFDTNFNSNHNYHSVINKFGRYQVVLDDNYEMYVHNLCNHAIYPSDDEDSN